MMPKKWHKGMNAGLPCKTIMTSKKETKSKFTPSRKWSGSNVHIGVLEFKGRVIASFSLKDKRRVIQSVQAKIRNRFNLSIAEVADQDDRQFVSLAVVGVGSNRMVVEKELEQALRLLEQTDGLEIIAADITF
ncbi:DUF503 domain-containing protein [Thermoactinomyces vulgaris]|nr:DUF503 domain-containing protein [Thermoactinomyces vulgaris]QCV55339.1 DUF503 domain-containing protein [Thermoactinomyces vulgaris]